MATPKNPTPQGISALLRKAGFERSASSPTRICGYRNHSDGYVVRGVSGTVTVYHQSSWFRPSDAEKPWQQTQQARYAEVIKAAGYMVVAGDGGYFGPIIVTALSEPTKA